MPRFLRGLFLAGALVLAGCSVGGGNSRDAVEEQKITKAQLAAMVLPREELGASVEGLTPDEDVGATGNAEAADDSLDPEDTATSLRGAGRVIGHKLYYTHPKLASLKVRKGALSVGTEVELLEDSVYAAQYLHKQLTDYERLKGTVEPGLKLRSISAFEAVAIGEEAGGGRGTITIPGLLTGHETYVVFRRHRIVATVAIVRADRRDVRQEALRIAVELDRRIQAVLAGEIDVTPPHPEKATKVAFQGRKRLPDLTMASADVAPGASPVAEEAKQSDDDYVSYSRTFEDVVVGGSHLVRLRAETQLYESETTASLSYKLVTKPAGRQIFAQGVVDAFAEETSVRPTKVRVRALENPGRGMSGVVVTFELVGAKFRMASIFMRSGRLLESVTGICRSAAFDPNDLRPVAERARRRLLA